VRTRARPWIVAYLFPPALHGAARATRCLPPLPPPRDVEEPTAASFIVMDANRFPVCDVYFELEPTSGLKAFLPELPSLRLSQPIQRHLQQFCLRKLLSKTLVSAVFSKSARAKSFSFIFAYENRPAFDASFLGWDPNDRGTSAFFELKNDGSPLPLLSTDAIRNCGILTTVLVLQPILDVLKHDTGRL
jgi:hypothetical protein